MACSAQGHSAGESSISGDITPPCLLWVLYVCPFRLHCLQERQSCHLFFFHLIFILFYFSLPLVFLGLFS